MDEKSDLEKGIDDFMLPGFRFHPTDEELVDFYLKRKLLNRSLPIELIKQVDIYKYDPWDLPKVASTGEKEWYFYCPRDRKYRNSTRPNRVTGSGFWKATGTDRPIYSSDGTKCIGLKKSLVFYRGRAAKGTKTDWMMHEFRLPATPPPPKTALDKTFPPTVSEGNGSGAVTAQDSWAICRIFKKTNSTASRALSHSWAASLSETTPSDAYTYTSFNSDNDFQHSLNFPLYKNLSAITTKPSTLTSSNDNYFPENFVFSPPSDTSNKSFNSTIFNMSPALACKNSDSIDFEHHFNNSYSVTSIQADINVEEDDQEGRKKNQNVSNLWENVRSNIGFPFSLPPAVPDSWKSNLPWESPPCPSEISSTTYSTNKCYI